MYVLGRPVAFNTCNGHLEFFVTKNIDPICQYNKGPSMQQPAAITISQNTAKVSKLKEYFCIIKDYNMLYVFYMLFHH